MRKLIINNETDWDTRAMRSVFLKVINENIAYEGPLRHTVKATIVSARSGRMSGYAYLNSGTMRLRVPKPTGDNSELDARKLAHLFEHELAHCRGYKHKGMCGLNNWHIKDDDYAYINGATINPRPVKLKPTVDIKQVRYKRILDKIAAWEAKARRARNALKKLSAQRKYYERSNPSLASDPQAS